MSLKHLQVKQESLGRKPSLAAFPLSIKFKNWAPESGGPSKDLDDSKKSVSTLPRFFHGSCHFIFLCYVLAMLFACIIHIKALEIALKAFVPVWRRRTSHFHPRTSPSVKFARLEWAPTGSRNCTRASQRTTRWFATEKRCQLDPIGSWSVMKIDEDNSYTSGEQSIWLVCLMVWTAGLHRSHHAFGCHDF